MTSQPSHAKSAALLLATDRLLGLDTVPIAMLPQSPMSGKQSVEPAEIQVSSGAQSHVTGESRDEPTADNKQQQLDDLRQRHDSECEHCTSAKDHTQTVFGEGHADADLMFIGEAPGEQEDRTGRPFVGRAGQKLDQIIEAMGLKREDVYIANVLKSRPPNNRTPLQNEVDACSPYLAEQVRIIRPRAIVTLGGPATKLILGTNVGITRLRGQWAEYIDDAMSIPVMPTFHPAYLLRNYTPDTRAKIWSDMQAVMLRLGLSA